jgi:hypothetical protein
MEPNSWKGSISSVSKEIPHLLWYLKEHHHMKFEVLAVVKLWVVLV